MRRRCNKCQELYEAKTAASEYCSARCRMAASRARKGESSSNVVELASVPRTPDELDLAPGPVFTATCAALIAAGRSETYLGALAMSLAASVDRAAEQFKAGLTRELRAAMVEALAGVAKDSDQIDEIKARRRARRGA